MMCYFQTKVHIHYSNRHALNVLALTRCTSWGNQERTGNCCCHVAIHQMTSIRWSSSHHRDAHCQLSRSQLSGPSHHTDDGSLMSATRHVRRDTRVCKWSHVQSSLWQIWWEIGAWLNLWPMMFLWKSSSILLLSFSLLLSLPLLIFSVLPTFFSLLLFKRPLSSSSFLLFLARSLAKLTSLAQALPLGLCFSDDLFESPDGPFIPPDAPLGPAWQFFRVDHLKATDAVWRNVRGLPCYG